MKITPEQAREALDAWICRPGMTQEQATILITEAFWALKERPNIDVQRVTDEGGAVDQRALGVNRVKITGLPGPMTCAQCGCWMAEATDKFAKCLVGFSEIHSG